MPATTKSITPESPAQTWRDLADQLTAEQVAHLEYWEAHPELPPRSDGMQPTAEEQRSRLLFSATESAWRNRAAERYSHITVPPGTTWAGDWSGDLWDSGEPATRHFEATKRCCGHMEVSAGGWQDSNGRTEWQITVQSTEQFNDGQMDAALAREVGAALIAAADELERLQ
ncbi:hypothetical protein PDG61_10090 [Mycolicibacterium sp. BiH015]|uniref:hypothetical protein n=1 Tax=Mycolicibacterium sp. BiH015 TaxID=3018808 RepID=UPI0022E4B3D8|nr:hypothetical protein [Mycolicibacterium sp. BiH015]MDA2891258.1 hypothetical protein [Mycolicibacterium sp. BiH015]